MLILSSNLGEVLIMQSSSVGAQEGIETHVKSVTFAAVLVLTLATLASPVTVRAAAPTFVDESASLNSPYAGESFGASWGDVNADGLPDLFVNRHRSRPALLVNQGDGTFEDRAFEVSTWDTIDQFADMHGASWADFNNDGFSDLFIAAGAADRSQFLVNHNGLLIDETASFTFDNVSWPGRQTMWYDFTRDGLLDFVVLQRGIAQTFEQTTTPTTDFTQINFLTGQFCDDNQYGHFADLDFDNSVDWICVSTIFPQTAYDVTGIPFIDITSSLAQEPNPVDTLFADFDGDLQNDIFMIRGRTRVSGAAQIDNTRAEAHLIAELGSENFFSFETTGDITIEIHWSARNVQDIHIGANGINPPFVSATEPITLTLSPSDPEVEGIMPHDPTTTRGLFVGFDSATNTWQFLNASGPQANFSYVYAFVESTSDITNVTDGGLQAIDAPQRPLLYTSSGSTYNDTTAAAGLDVPHACISVVAADFDNDMDQDLYLVCRDAVLNTPNLYYENDGSGVFTLSGTFGAEGPVGAGVGLGEAVVAADYDVDGFVDLFVTNGLKLFPEDEFNTGGPDSLFRNQGNSNQWIEIDLEGTTSNRDGLGAVITVTAGGVSQRFENNGGYHRWSQNDQRTHVGLAQNTTADVEVVWPTGVTETFANLAAGNVHLLVEGGGSSVVTIPTSIAPSACGLDGGGQPPVNFSEVEGVFLWRDCADETSWHLRASAGLATPVTIVGSITATQDFSSVVPQSLESTDVLDFTTQPSVVSYSLEVGVGGFDGFDFSFPAGADVCFQIQSPSNEAALLGFYQTPQLGAIDLNSLGACTNVVPSINPISASAGEANTQGEILVPLQLSGISDSVITVDYVTQDGTAEADIDYVPSSGTATFNPGELETFVSIALVDDGLAEPAETIELVLSDPSNATLASTSVLATILDDEPLACGPIAFDAATEEGVFIALNCNTNVWSVRVASGGGGTSFEGRLSSDQPFTSLSGVSLEPSDVFDTTDPAALDFTLNVFGNGVDGFDFTIPAGAALCFDLDSPVSALTLFGAGRAPLPNTVDLITLGNCTNTPPALSVQAVSVDENAAAAAVSVDITLSAPSLTPVTVDVATVDGTAQAGVDFQAFADTVTFAPGDILQSVTIPILDDLIAEGAENFALQLTNPVNAEVDAQQGSIEIVDDEASPCGPQTFDSTTDQGVFLVRDCDTLVWSLRVAQGGGNFVRYIGTIESDQPLVSVTPQLVEPNDTVALTTPALVDFDLGVGGTGVDGFDFLPASETGVCVSLGSAPVTTVFLGAQQTPVAVPFDLGTLGPCTNVVPTADVSVVDVPEDDASGVMDFTITLSEPTGVAVTVDFATVDGTAVAGEDYVAASGTLNFTPGQLSQVVSVAILDDAQGEVDEQLSLQLTNPVGVVLGVASVAGTIIDDEGVSTLAVVDAAASENDVSGTLIVDVTLSQISANIVSATFTTIDGSAEAGEDYVAQSGVVEFQPGELLQTISIELLDDGFAEGPESLLLELSSPTQGVLGDGLALLEIADDEPSPCGPQNIDAAVDAGIFLARVCGTDTWELRIPGGGNGFAQFSGTVMSTLPLTTVTGFGLEPNDVLDTPAPGEISYQFGVGGTGVDGLDFEHPTGRDICIDLAPGSGTEVLVGADRTPVAVPFDLGTLGACNNLTPVVTAADITVDEAAPTAQATVTVTLSQQTNSTVSVDYATLDGTAVAGLDYQAAQNSLTFLPGETSQTITLDLLDDTLAEGPETFSVTFSNPLNAELANPAALVTIVDDEPSPCGPLDHIRGLDTGVFVGLDCATGVWSVRVVENGSFIFYDGDLVSDAALSSFTPVGIEGHDTLTNSPSGTVDYTFGVGGTGEDGFDFTPAPDASLCLSLDSPTRSIFVGAARVEFTGSVDLRTLQACQ